MNVRYARFRLISVNTIRIAPKAHFMEEMVLSTLLKVTTKGYIFTPFGANVAVHATTAINAIVSTRRTNSE